MGITIRPPENVYRKPHELVSSVSYLSAALGTVFLPVPPAAVAVSAPVLLALSALRAKQGLRIRRYRCNLSRLTFYAMTPAQIPVSDKALFLGKGFKWTQTHTQRLLMARLPENEKLLEPGRLYRWARQKETDTSGISWLTRKTSAQAWWNPVAPLPPVGGKPELHGVEPYESDIWFPLGERVGHTIVLGTTRVGKTRLAEILINQDIMRGDTVITFDPKGDADLMLAMYAAARKAGRPFYMFHLGFPEQSCRYNPIGDFTRITEVATRIANNLPDEGQSAAFRDFVWRFVNVLGKMMEALSIKPSYILIYRCAVNVDDLAAQYFASVLDKECSGWKDEFEEFELSKAEMQQVGKTGRSIEAVKLSQFLKRKKLNNALSDAVAGILGNERSYFEKLVSSLYPLLEKLTSGKVVELISPDFENLDDTRPIMDWRKVMEQNAVVYVGLDALTDAEVAAAVGNAMFADLTSLAGQIYKHGHGYGQSGATGKRKIAIHADEFNELIGNEFIPMLNKAGGAGYQVTAYTQTWSDVEAKIGSKAKAEQMGGNFNTMIMLRVKLESTAKMLASQLPDVRVVTGTLVSGAGDIASPEGYEDFTSSNEDRLSSETVPTLMPADLTSLPKGQAFALLEGGNLYKLRLPLPLPDPNSGVPDNLAEMASQMRETVRLSRKPENDKEELFVEGRHYG